MKGKNSAWVQGLILAQQTTQTETLRDRRYKILLIEEEIGKTNSGCKRYRRTGVGTAWYGPLNNVPAVEIELV
jgi:hypothetical protein